MKEKEYQVYQFYCVYTKELTTINVMFTDFLSTVGVMKKKNRNQFSVYTILAFLSEIFRKPLC